ncbi:MAG TPA: stalk domain-containing protein, partial [Trueperaceae bacterium]
MAGAAATAQQQTLVVNGVPVAGVNSSLVTDQAYAPAETLAAALGADYDFDAGRQVAIFEMASRLLTLDIYADPKEAAVATQALKKNGKPRTSTGGILIQSQVMVPVKTLAMAFGGRVAYLAASNRVLVVTPRARLRLVRPPSQRDEVERFVLSFNAPAGMSRQDDIAQNQVIFRFPRTDYDQTRTFHGSNFREARLTGADGQVVFTLDLRPVSRYQSYTTPDPGGGFSLVVDVFAATSPQATGRETLTPRRIVLDPGHGGRDQGLAFPGVGSES